MADARKIIVLFSNQLFADHPAVNQASHVLLVEDPRFFLDFNYCKSKLVLHRASMRAYNDYLTAKGKVVKYVDFEKASAPGFIEEFLSDKSSDRIMVFEPEDFAIERLIDNIADKSRFNINIFENPLFMTGKERLFELFGDKERYSMNSFYIAQRKHFNILLEDGKAMGGKWSYDKENRKPPSEDIKIKTVKGFKNSYVPEAVRYVEHFFGANPGSCDDFIYPVTFEEAEIWLDDFLRNRFRFFGDYQDAILAQEHFMFHSLLSSSLNIGLLSPSHVVESAIKYADKNNVSLNNLEGFIRQIVGWREFVRAVHVFKENKIRERNFWRFKKKMPIGFYEATTGIEPVDTIIKKVLKYGYAHHIERLMILGTFMLLCEIHPDYVYKWFMELFVDSYDWVMTPNVYGMSQYAAGDLMTTKPYICSSNYILKMSDFKKGRWCDIWDSLYWRFIYNHSKVFEKNARMKVMLYHLDKMDKEKINNYNATADQYLKGLYSGRSKI